MADAPPISQLVDELYRSESRRVFATLIRILGDFELAEEALHDAFAAAVEQWSKDGVPVNPRAWLVSAGRFKAVDTIRRRKRFDASLEDLAGRLGEFTRQIGETLRDDPGLRHLVNRFARRVAAGTAARYGGNIVTLVSETVRSWDAQTVTDRLENAVGRDLQYIRINGTLVGGLVGVALHTLAVLL